MRKSALGLFLIFFTADALFAFPKDGNDPGVRMGEISLSVFKKFEDGRLEQLNGTDVELVRFELESSGAEGKEVTIGGKKTDKDGLVFFKGLQTGGNVVYLARVQSAGAIFKTPLLSLLNNTRIKEELVIYETKETDDSIRIFQKHTIIEEQGDTVIFRDLLIIENTSGRAYFPKKGEGLKINLPKGVRNIKFMFDGPPDLITYDQGMDYFILSAPVLPGHANMISLGMTYEAFLKDGRLELEAENNYPVVSAVVLNGVFALDVAGKELRSIGKRRFADRIYTALETNNAAKGEVMALSIKMKRAKFMKSGSLVLTIAGLIIVFALFASCKRKETR